MYGALAELAFLNLLLPCQWLEREGGDDMHAEADSSSVQVLEDSNTGGSCSQGWNELEDGKKLPNGWWHNGERKEAMDLATDAQRRIRRSVAHTRGHA
jgi:hypothetical protein